MLWSFIIWGVFVLLVIKILKYLNKDYFLLSLCKRIKTVDGSKLETKVNLIPGSTIFGNNIDVLNNSACSLFKLVRSWNEKAKHKSYVLYFVDAPMLNIVTAEEAEKILQSQNLITKSVLYDLLRPFLGEGLLISTDKKWHFRRKLLTPAFHFNILQNFLDIFIEERDKLIQHLHSKVDENVCIQDFIPQFTLNNICETALGVKLDNIEGGQAYREAIHQIEEVIVERVCNPLLYIQPIFYIWGSYKKQKKNLGFTNKFSNKIIEQRRLDFKKLAQNQETQELRDEYGKKKRYAMLDTLLDAESKGLIDAQGICDEVNTFMFEGFDTTSTCLTMSLLNFAWFPHLQMKCFEELQNIDDIENLSIFDFNKMEYLECFIKETLRMYPSVPYFGRQLTEESVVNGLIMPKKTQINIHSFDIMRDPRHFTNPNQFDPNRFLPQNTINRHPFAFIAFSAGPRNCIGQKFAMLEIKVILSAILKNFVIKPVTQLQDIDFENGIVLRTHQKVHIKLCRRF